VLNQADDKVRQWRRALLSVVPPISRQPGRSHYPWNPRHWRPKHSTAGHVSNDDKQLKPLQAQVLEAETCDVSSSYGMRGTCAPGPHPWTDLTDWLARRRVSVV